jgi:hypothetical protein
MKSRDPLSPSEITDKVTRYGMRVRVWCSSYKMKHAPLCVLGASSSYIITVSFRSTLLYEPLMQRRHELSVLAIPVSIRLFLRVQNGVCFTLERHV